MAFYKATAGQRFSRRPGFEGQSVIQKSVTDDDLARLRPRLMLRLAPASLDASWQTEEVPDELQSAPPERVPPGWAAETRLSRELHKSAELMHTDGLSADQAVTVLCKVATRAVYSDLDLARDLGRQPITREAIEQLVEALYAG